MLVIVYREKQVECPVKLAENITAVSNEKR